MSNPVNPYVGTRTFSEEDTPRYFGREREARDLLALVAFEQVVLFYAQSGTGKSSLINTRLIPGLEKDGRFEVLTPSRVTGDIPIDAPIENVYVYSLLQNLADHTVAPDYLAGMHIKDVLPKLVRDSAKPQRSFKLGGNGDETQKSKRRVLIIDQFEELFTTHPEEWESRSDFFDQLAEALEADPALWVVLVMREDDIAHVDPYAHLMPGGLRVRYYMQKMEYEDALKAVKNPAADAGRPFEDGVAEQLVTDLRGRQLRKRGGNKQTVLGQYVEPIVLQAVCSTLWENLDRKDKTITATALKELGNVDKALGKYYEKRVHEVAIMDEVKKLGIRESEIRNWIGTQLITPEGRRNIVVRRKGGRSGGLNDVVVQLFSIKKDLIREEGHGDASIYELTHDRLADPILENNKEWEKDHGFPFHTQVILWNDAWGEGKEVHLLGEKAIEEAEKWNRENPDQLSNLETAFLEACQAKIQAEENKRNQELKTQRQKVEDAERLAKVKARSARIAQMFTFGAVLLALIALGLFVYAQEQAQNAANNEIKANIEATKANELASDAQARELASAAESNLNSRLDLSILLSLEAYKAKSDNPAAESALFDSMQRSQRLKGFLATANDPAEEFRYSPDGNFIAVLKKDGISLWEIRGEAPKPVTGADPIPFSNELLFGNNNYFGDRYRFSPDSAYLIFVNRAGLYFWDTQNGGLLRDTPLNDHIGSVMEFALNPETRTMATRGENGDMTLWNLDNLSSDQPIGYSGDVVTFSSNGRKFAVLDSQTGLIKVGSVDWQETGDELISISREPDSTTSIAFDQSGNLLILGTKNGAISILDLANSEEQGPIDTKTNSLIYSATLNSTRDIVTYLTASGIYFLKVNNPGDPGNPLSSNGFRVENSGDVVAYSTLDFNTKITTVTLENVINQTPIGNPIVGDWAVFSQDGNKAAVFDGTNNKISILDLSNNASPDGSPLQRTNDSNIQTMVFSTDGNLLAAGTDTGRIELWNLSSQTFFAYDPLPSTNSLFAITSLTFGLDGNTLMAGKADGTFGILNIETNKLNLSTTKKTGYQGRITSFDISLNGEVLYSRAGDGYLFSKDGSPTADVVPGNQLFFVYQDDKLERLIVGTNKNTVIVDPSTMTSIGKGVEGRPYILSPHNDTFVTQQDIKDSSGKSYQYTVWDSLSGERLSDALEGSYVQFSPDGSSLSVTAAPKDEETLNRISIWSLSSRSIIIEPMPAITPSFSTDGRFVSLSNTQTNQFVVWNLTKGAQIGESFSGYPVFAPKKSLFAVVQPDGIITFWNTDTGEQIETDDPVMGNNVQFTPDGEYFAVSAYGSIYTVTVWNTSAMNPEYPLPGQFVYTYPSPYSYNTDYSNNGFGLGPQNHTMILAGDAGINLWDLSTGKLLDQPSVSGANIYMSPRGNYLILSSYYGYGYPSTIWDLQSNRELFTFQGGFIGISSDEKLLITSSSSSSGVYQLVDMETGKQMGNIARISPTCCTNVILGEPYSGYKNTLVFNPDAIKNFATLSPEDGSLMLWDTQSPPSIPGDKIDLGTTPDSILNTAISPAGDKLAVSTQDSILLFATDLIHNSAKLDQELPNNHIRSITDILQSPDNNSFVTFYEDSSLALWHRADGNYQIVKTLKNVASGFSKFSPDGAILATASPANSSIYLFTLSDVKTGKPIGNPLFGQNLDFSPNGRYVALYNSYNPGIRVYDATTGELINQAPYQNFRAFGRDSQNIVASDGFNISLWNFGSQDSEDFKDRGGGAFILSPDESMLALFTDKNIISLKNLTDNSFAGEITLDEKSDGNLGSISPDNRVLSFFNYGTNEFTLYDIEKGFRIGEKESSIKATTLQFSPTGKYAIAYNWYSPDNFSIWDTTTGTRIEGSVSGSFVGFGDDDNALITRRSQDNTVNIYELTDTINLPRSIAYPDGLLINAEISPDNSNLLLYGNQGVTFYDLANPAQPGATYSDTTGRPQRMIFNNDATLLATVGSDGLHVWDLSGQTPAQFETVLKGQDGRISDVRFTSDNQIIYQDSRGNLYKVAVSKIVSIQNEQTLKTGPSDTCAGSLSPQGTYAVKITSEKFQIWNILNSSSPPVELDIEGGSCSGSMAFSLSEQSFAYGHPANYRIYTFKPTEDGTPFKERAELIARPEDNPPYTSLAFLSGENLLVSQTGSNRIFLWDIENRTQIAASDLAGTPMLHENGKIMIFLSAEKEFVNIDITPENLTTRILDDWTKQLCNRVSHNLFPAERSQYFRNDEANHARTCPNLKEETNPETNGF